MTRHEIIENLSVALDTLRARKVRSGLTILGIVIGVTTVIAVASIIDGLNGEIKERVQRLGSNTLFITRIPPMQNTARLPAKIRMRKYLEDEDAAFIEESSPAVSYATVFANRINFNDQADEIRYGDAHVERFFLRGVQPALHQRLPSVRRGRGAVHFGLRRGARAQCDRDRPRHRGFAFPLRRPAGQDSAAGRPAL